MAVTASLQNVKRLAGSSSIAHQRHLQLQLIADRDAIVTQQGDIRFEAARYSHSAGSQRAQTKAAFLVEAQGVQVEVRHYNVHHNHIGHAFPWGLCDFLRQLTYTVLVQEPELLAGGQRHFIFGIRHHGPGSALALRRALQDLRPDIVLVEGPPDGSSMIPWLNHPQMALPAALLIYRPDQPRRAAYFPFTEFSPETQALRYALEQGVPPRFADLEQRHLLAGEALPAMPGQDVFQTLTEASGHLSHEAWWNITIEQRRDSRDLFAAVLELMAALRAETEANSETEAAWAERREARMRSEIRRALVEGFERVAFVCGAWHAPALQDLSQAAEDERLLQGLETVEVAATWVPWTYSRLSMTSGYGAGIASPGWYDHLWSCSLAGDSRRAAAAGWLARVAALLRDAGFAASPAHVIETLRLAEALAALRDLPIPGLPELNEATVAVLCEGHAEPMALIQRKLIVGERLGLVPPDIPMVPLQRDLLRLQRDLALHPDGEQSTLRLDVRDDLDSTRSCLLHRLLLLGVPWGEPVRRGNAQTPSLESWRLQWRPEFTVRLIEASMWGNTVEEGAAAFVEDTAARAERLVELTALLDRVLPADLPRAVAAIVARIEDESAVSSDIPHMMEALPPLARVLRYGSAQRIDQQMMAHIVDSLLARICIGLPSTCAGMDDDPAQQMAGRLATVTGVVHTLQRGDQTARWHDALFALLAQQGVHGLLDGRASRLLLDEDALAADAAAARMERALRRGASPLSTPEQAAQSAAWLDGFLAGGELLLIHDRRLWQLLDSFINQLPARRFVEVLPLLRRAFSQYSEAARRQLQERARHAESGWQPEMPVYAEFDHQRAEAVLPLLSDFLGAGTGRK